MADGEVIPVPDDEEAILAWALGARVARASRVAPPDQVGEPPITAGGLAARVAAMRDRIAALEAEVENLRSGSAVEAIGELDALLDTLLAADGYSAAVERLQLALQAAAKRAPWIALREGWIV